MKILRDKKLVLNNKYYILIIIISLSSCKTPKISLPAQKIEKTENYSRDTIINNIIENKELTRQQRKALRDFYSFQIDILQKENKGLKIALKNQRKELESMNKYEIKQQQNEIKILKEKNRSTKQKNKAEQDKQQAAYKHIENQLKEERKKAKKKSYLVHFIASILINFIFLLLFIKKVLI